MTADLWLRFSFCLILGIALAVGIYLKDRRERQSKTPAKFRSTERFVGCAVATAPMASPGEKLSAPAD